MTASVTKTRTQLSENSCEKSCQVTSEQIKADMKAATESNKRTCNKGITTEAGGTNARQGVESGTVRGTVNAEEAGRTVVRQGPGSLGRVGAGEATSRQVAGSGRVVSGTSQRGTTIAAIGTGRTNKSPETSFGGRTVENCTRGVGVRHNTDTGSVDSLQPRKVDGNHAARTAALADGQGDRQLDAPVSHPVDASTSQHGWGREDDFVPRRPLTRSCTRMSSLSLVPEAGKNGLAITVE